MLLIVGREEKRPRGLVWGKGREEGRQERRQEEGRSTDILV